MNVVEVTFEIQLLGKENLQFLHSVILLRKFLKSLINLIEHLLLQSFHRNIKLNHNVGRVVNQVE